MPASITFQVFLTKPRAPYSGRARLRFRRYHRLFQVIHNRLPHYVSAWGGKAHRFDRAGTHPGRVGGGAFRYAKPPRRHAHQSWRGSRRCGPWRVRRGQWGPRSQEL